MHWPVPQAIYTHALAGTTGYIHAYTCRYDRLYTHMNWPVRQAIYTQEMAGEGRLQPHQCDVLGPGQPINAQSVGHVMPLVGQVEADETRPLSGAVDVRLPPRHAGQGPVEGVAAARPQDAVVVVAAQRVVAVRLVLAPSALPDQVAEQVLLEVGPVRHGAVQQAVIASFRACRIL